MHTPILQAAGDDVTTQFHVYTTLQNHHTTSHNLSKHEREALKNIKDNENIVVVKADKGNTIVIMNKVDYIKKMNDILQDESKFTPLKKDQTKTFERKLNGQLWKLEEPLGSRLYHSLRSTDGTCPRVYGTIKLHKEGMPLRPITSFIGSPAYNLSKYLSTVLTPLTKKEHSLKNSTEARMLLNQLKLAPDEELVSYDVISLFPSVPIKEVSEIIQEKLTSETLLHERCVLSPQEIMTLLHLVLNNSTVKFDGQFYKQLDGTPMGSNISCVVADIMLEHVENRALNGQAKPVLYRRYVDDCLAVIKNDQIDQFHQQLNEVSDKIQFTVERSKDNVINFLDLKITKKQDGTLDITVFRKPTHSGRYLDFSSNHPIQHKKAVAKNLYHRALTIPNSDNHIKDEMEHATRILRQNGYPMKFLRQIIYEVRNKHPTPPENERTKNYVVLPYVGPTSEKIKRVLHKHNIRTVFRPNKKLCNLVGHLKDPIDHLEQKELIYEIPCGDCHRSYVGQTKQSLASRSKQHLRDCKNKSIATELADHHTTDGHQFQFENVKILAKEADPSMRRFKESFYIRTKSTINKRVEHIPPQYLVIPPP